MQKNLLLIPFIALTLLITKVEAASPSPLVSPSPSPTISPSPSGDDEASENLKQRFKDSISSDEDTPASLLTAKRAYIGTVKDVIKDTVIVEDKDGKKDIKVSDETTILRSPGNAVIKQDSIKIDDYIIAIGTPKGDEILDAIRLIVSTASIDAPAKASGIGEIKKITKTSLVVMIEGSEKTIAINTKSIYKSPVATIELGDLSVSDTIIYTATKDAKDALTATVIMRIGSTSL